MRAETPETPAGPRYNLPDMETNILNFTPMLFALSWISYPRIPSIDLSEMSVQVVTVNKEALDVVATVPNEDMAVKIVKGRVRTHGHDSTLSSRNSKTILHTNL